MLFEKFVVVNHKAQCLNLKIQNSMLSVQRIKKLNFKQPIYLVVTLLSITFFDSSLRNDKTDVCEMPDSIQVTTDSINEHSTFASTYVLDPEHY